MFHATESQRRFGLALLRMGVGIVFFMHGLLKLQTGHAGVTGFFAQVGVPAPSATAFALTWLELIGGPALMLGLFTRVIALGLAVDVAGAMVLVHWKNGFFADKGGIELVFTLLVAALALAIAGPGAASLDQLIARRREARP